MKTARGRSAVIALAGGGRARRFPGAREGKPTFAAVCELRGKKARDGTKYGRSRASATSFFVHHTQQLSAAAQVGDAKAIRRAITSEKMSIMKRAVKAGGWA